jgi:hypothetical protein
VRAHDGRGRRDKVIGSEMSALPASKYEPDNKDQDNQATDPASDRRTPIVVAAAATKKQQQNQNDQNCAHRECPPKARQLLYRESTTCGNCKMVSKFTAWQEQ